MRATTRAGWFWLHEVKETMALARLMEPGSATRSWLVREARLFVRLARDADRLGD